MVIVRYFRIGPFQMVRSVRLRRTPRTLRDQPLGIGAQRVIQRSDSLPQQPGGAIGFARAGQPFQFRVGGSPRDQRGIHFGGQSFRRMISARRSSSVRVVGGSIRIENGREGIHVRAQD